MAEQDLQRFLRKVQQLQQMVNSLDKVEGRRDSLAACENHNQVVELARSWGYEIGRRWGAADSSDSQLSEENLLGRLVPPVGHEQKYLIKEGCHWRLELIYSCDASSEEDFWYNQNEHEWIGTPSVSQSGENRSFPGNSVVGFVLDGTPRSNLVFLLRRIF